MLQMWNYKKKLYVIEKKPNTDSLITCFISVRLYERHYGDPSENFDASRPDFQDHSRSSDPTRSISYL